MCYAFKFGVRIGSRMILHFFFFLVSIAHIILPTFVLYMYSVCSLDKRRLRVCDWNHRVLAWPYSRTNISHDICDKGREAFVVWFDILIDRIAIGGGWCMDGNGNGNFRTFSHHIGMHETRYYAVGGVYGIIKQQSMWIDANCPINISELAPIQCYQFWLIEYERIHIYCPEVIRLPSEYPNIYKIYYYSWCWNIRLKSLNNTIEIDYELQLTSD